MKKRCSKCGETKPPDAFSKDRSQKNGLQTRCKACHRDYLRQWYAERPEKRREYNRQWYAANLEKKREYDRQRRADNPEKKQECDRQWKKNNPDKRRAYKQRRRAKKRNLSHDLEDWQWEYTLDAFDHRCAYCGRLPDLFTTFHQDHVIPVSKGGGWTLGNIVPACRDCNLQKNDRDWREWMREKGYDANLFQTYLEHLSIA